MTKFYLKLRKDTLAYQQTPQLPQGFFKTKADNDRERENKKLAQEYEQLHEDKWAEYEIAVWECGDLLFKALQRARRRG